MASPSTKSAPIAVRGRVLRFTADPFVAAPAASYEYLEDGVVVLAGGNIQSVADASKRLDLPPQTEVHHFRDHLILPGFVDCHAHYPQINVVGSYGEQLIDWLTKYTFPAESKFSDKSVASVAANAFLQEELRNGVTTVSAYCTIHPESVDAFFEAASARNMLVLGGKVFMNRNAPDTLTEFTDATYADTRALIKKWHGRGRNIYTLTPRFAPTSTPDELKAVASLWDEFPGLRMQTHLSETKDEVEWVKGLFPDARDYLDVYDRFGLVRAGAIFGHCIYLSDVELNRLSETGAAIAHCPTSNTFLGSGLFDLFRARKVAGRIKIGLGSDIGGGSSFSMFKTMLAAYEAAQLNGATLHPVQAFYLATQAGADALELGDRVGNIVPGKDADLTIVGLRATDLLSLRMDQAKTLDELLFLLMVLGDDRAIAATIAGGKFAYRREA